MGTVERALRGPRQLLATIFECAPRQASASLIGAVGLSATEGIGLLLLIPLLQLVGLEASQSALSGILARVSGVLARVGLTPTLPTVLTIYVIVIALQSTLRRRQSIVGVTAQQAVTVALRRRLYRAIAGTEWTFFVRYRTSDAMHALTSEVDRVGTAVVYLLELIAIAATTLVYVVLALRVSPAMTTLVLLLGGALVLLVQRPFSQSRGTGERFSTVNARFYNAIAEHLAGMKLARAYGVVRRHAEAFDELAANIGNLVVESTVNHARLQQQFAIGSAVVLAILVYVSYAVLRVDTVQLLFLLFLFARLVPRLTGVYERAQMLVSMIPAFDVVTDLEARCLAAAEPVDPRPVAVALTKAVQFDAVGFAYRNDGGPEALSDISLTIDAGTTVAIVGVSGSGKSTLADILMGLLTPGRGRVLIDGVPLDAAARASWQKRIGFVPQDTFLFHDTVRANLVWANAAATDDEIWRALRLASADEFVAALPQGLATVVGDRGVLLSGGERQRLTLARAVMGRPDLLILDEATSSLDSENERRIRDAIARLHHQATIVVITHRLSMVRAADRIHLLEQGRLVESGSWDELVACSTGRFRELCAAQGLL